MNFAATTVAFILAVAGIVAPALAVPNPAGKDSIKDACARLDATALTYQFLGCLAGVDMPTAQDGESGVNCVSEADY